MQYQTAFFKIIKSIVSPTLSLPHEMADLLGISLDSAYRRIRCETPLTLEETVQLCLRFDVPLEALNSSINEVVTFHYQLMFDQNNAISHYLNELKNQLQFISQKQTAKLYYAAEDIPVFYHFSSFLLTKFKLYYWRKSILNETSTPLRFSEFEVNGEDEALIKSISESYSKINSIEIWTDETVKSTLQQIKFYWDAGFFDHPSEAVAICNELLIVFQNIQQQAEMGLKKGEHAFTGSDFSIYHSDLMIGNNCVFFESDDTTAVFLGYNSFNFIRTINKDFAAQNKIWMENLLKKATLISKTGEKQRNQFFKKIIKQTEALIELIKSE
jgi:hypothetical protein